MSSPADRNDSQSEDDQRREKVAAIKLWTLQNLPLTEETVLSVSEFNCKKPNCPNRQTVILVLAENAPTRKISIHRTIADVSEAEVFDACLELLRTWDDPPPDK